MRGYFVAIALSLGAVGMIAQTQPVAVYIKAPRTSADPRAKLVKDLLAASAKELDDGLSGRPVLLCLNMDRAGRADAVFPQKSKTTAAG